ncbi:flagellar hook-length control protein FliK [Roseateles sp. GG27B]
MSSLTSTTPTALVNNLPTNARSTGQQARLAAMDGTGSFSQLLSGYGKPPQLPAAISTAPADKPAGADAHARAHAHAHAPKSASQSNGDGKTETQRQESKLNNKSAGQSDVASRRTSGALAHPEAARSTAQNASSKLPQDEAARAGTAKDAAAAEAITTTDLAEASSPATEDAAAQVAAAAAVAVAAELPAASTVVPDSLPSVVHAADASKKPGIPSDHHADLTLTDTSDAGRSGLPARLGPGRTEQAAWPDRAQVSAQAKAEANALGAAEPGGLGVQKATAAFSTELQSALPVQSSANGKTPAAALESLVASMGISTPSEFKTAATAATAAPPTVVSLAQPLFEPAFAPAMAARLSLLAANGVQTAQLHLNPAELGPVAVQIVVDGQQAQVSFHAEQAATCAVLERSLPDLAAALRDAGLTLSGGGVFQQAPDRGSDSDGHASSDNNSGNTATRRVRTAGLDLPLSALGNAPASARASRGVLDLYA